jgi:hypothetical protein
MTFRCLLIGQSLLILHHHYFWSQSQRSDRTIASRTIKLAGNKSEIIQITFQTAKIWSKQFWPDERLRFNLRYGCTCLQHRIFSLGLQLGSAPTQLGSTRLGAAQLESDDVAGGSHYADVSVDWSLTWHANCVCLHHAYIMMTSSWACLLCMMTSQLCHADIILIRVSHMGRVNWYFGRVSPSGWRRRVARVCARGQSPRRRMTSDSDVVFTSGFVSSSSMQWYGQNTILTTFIFEQKSNTTLNHQLWYQL